MAKSGTLQEVLRAPGPSRDCRSTCSQELCLCICTALQTGDSGSPLTCVNTEQRHPKSPVVQIYGRVADISSQCRPVGGHQGQRGPSRHKIYPRIWRGHVDGKNCPTSIFRTRIHSSSDTVGNFQFIHKMLNTGFSDSLIRTEGQHTLTANNNNSPFQGMANT